MHCNKYAYETKCNGRTILIAIVFSAVFFLFSLLIVVILGENIRKPIQIWFEICDHVKRNRKKKLHIQTPSWFSFSRLCSAFMFVIYNIIFFFSFSYNCGFLSLYVHCWLCLSIKQMPILKCKGIEKQKKRYENCIILFILCFKMRNAFTAIILFFRICAVGSVWKIFLGFGL